MFVTLWNVIRDFFVVYMFGGVTSDGESIYSGMLGNFIASNGDLYGPSNTAETFLPLTASSSETITFSYISLGDWLSSTCTIITLILICYVFLKITVWLFKWGAGLFKW